MKSVEKFKEDKYAARFASAPWLNPLNIIIVGLGGIGSHTARILATQGHTLHLFDDDKYEEANMGPQLMHPNWLGDHKARAQKEMLEEATGNKDIHFFNERYEKDSPVANVMIAAVDNMPTRKLMLEKWFENVKRPEHKNSIKLFIDGGMEAEFCVVRAIRTHGHYKQWMDDYKEVISEATQCSFKSTSHLGFMIGGLIVSILNNHIANKLDPDGIALRTVPYRTHFSAITMKTTLS